MNFVILALAVARFARLITIDSILDTPRNWLLKRWPADDTVFGDSEVSQGKTSGGAVVIRGEDGWYALHPSKWSELLTCYWCASVWVAIIVWAAYSVYPDVTVLITAPFALSFAAGFLNDWT